MPTPVVIVTETSPRVFHDDLTGRPLVDTGRGGTGPPSDTTVITIAGTAGVTLSGHRAVVPQADGTFIYADAFTLAHLGLPVFLTTGAAMIGTTASCVALGPVVEPTWTWSSGPIYLGASGNLVQTPPAGAVFWLQVAGYLTPTSLFFNPKGPIRL